MGEEPRKSQSGGLQSEFSLKLQEQLDECVMLLMIGTVNTECLCFLTTNEASHTTFRKISLLTNLIEGAPIVLLEIVFSYHHGWHGIIALSLAFGVGHLILKLFRVWIIVHTAGCEVRSHLWYLFCHDFEHP